MLVVVEKNGALRSYLDHKGLQFHAREILSSRDSVALGAVLAVGGGGSFVVGCCRLGEQDTLVHHRVDFQTDHERTVAGLS